MTAGTQDPGEVMRTTLSGFVARTWANPIATIRGAGRAGRRSPAASGTAVRDLIRPR